MTIPREFGDLPHLYQIKDHLWRPGPHGQAAVMVGAGFSRLASRVVATAPPFPLWSDLSFKLCQALSPNLQEDENARIALTQSPPRLAAEYDAYFGREALNKFLLKAIPNMCYVPADHHKLLLKLPWSSIFTTNYDSLLERTRPYVQEQNYDVVYTCSDICRTTEPRIVKLHGSLPSHMPLVFTEEDYRRYPIDFAPFVNCVQQSLMENVFCLLGYSGEDSNFLNWIGWVRDNLGHSAPKLFLCGVFDASPSQRQLLDRRNVSIVDLGPLFPPNGLASDQRHSRALFWFLRFLLLGKPLDPEDWPEAEPPDDPAPQEGPTIPCTPTCSLAPARALLNSKTDAAALRKLIRFLESNRKAYPGWVVCPQHVRTTLWHSLTTRGLEEATSQCLRLSEGLLIHERLYLLRELAWLFEISLLPVTEELGNGIKELTEVVSSFLVQDSNSSIEFVHDVAPKAASPVEDPNQGEESMNGATDTAIPKYLPRVQECWMQLMLTRLTGARSRLDEEMFESVSAALGNLSPITAEAKARLAFEKCRMHLAKFDVAAFERDIGEWLPPAELPFWRLRRAALLAEFGLLEEALNTSVDALNYIGAQESQQRDELTLLSQEGWGKHILQLIEDARASEKSKRFSSTGFRRRWRKLAAFECDPRPEIERLSGALLSIKREIRPTKEERAGFDPYTANVSHTLAGKTLFNRLRPMYAFVRLAEDGMMLARAGNVFRYQEEISEASTIILASNPAHSLSLILRWGDKNDVEILSRMVLLLMPQADVEKIYKMLHAAIPSAYRNWIGNRESLQKCLVQRIVTTGMEVLSRVAFRLTEEQRQVLFDFALEVYTIPSFPLLHTMANPLGNLFKRILFAATEEETIKYLPLLAKLPIVGEPSSGVTQFDGWPEPFVYLRRELIRVSTGAKKVEAEHLISALRSQQIETRTRAYSRLRVLHRHGLLDRSQTRAFADALWAQIDDRTGLPKLRSGSYYSHTFLSDPDPEPGMTIKKLKAWVLSQVFPRIPREKNIRSIPSPVLCSELKPLLCACTAMTVSPVDDGKARSVNRVRWNRTESLRIIRSALEFWRDEKAWTEPPHRTQHHSDLFDDGDYREVLRVFGDLAYFVCTLRIGITRPPKWVTESVPALIWEMHECGVPVLQALPFLLADDVGCADEHLELIQDGLSSSEDFRFSDATWAVENWIKGAFKGILPKPPRTLMQALIRHLQFGERSKVSQAVRVLACLAADVPEALSSEEMRGLVSALDHLYELCSLSMDLETYVYDSILEKDPTSSSGVLECFAASSRLSAVLYEFFVKKRAPVPKEVERWKNLVLKTPLPEAQYAWETSSE